MYSSPSIKLIWWFNKLNEVAIKVPEIDKKGMLILFLDYFSLIFPVSVGIYAVTQIHLQEKQLKHHSSPTMDSWQANIFWI